MRLVNSLVFFNQVALEAVILTRVVYSTHVKMKFSEVCCLKIHTRELDSRITKLSLM